MNYNMNYIELYFTLGREVKDVKSITIHGLDDTIDRLIREKAQRYSLSLNKTIKILLSESLGISTLKKHSKNDFDKFYGIWSKKDTREFDKAVSDFEKIDREDWE